MPAIPHGEFGFLTVVVNREDAENLKERLGELAGHMTESRPMHNQGRSRPFHETHFAFQLNLNADTPQEWVTKLCAVALQFGRLPFYVGHYGEVTGYITNPEFLVDYTLPNGAPFLLFKPISNS